MHVYPAPRRTVCRAAKISITAAVKHAPMAGLLYVASVKEYDVAVPNVTDASSESETAGILHKMCINAAASGAPIAFAAMYR